jgi:hypothetical protein
MIWDFKKEDNMGEEREESNGEMFIEKKRILKGQK